MICRKCAGDGWYPEHDPRCLGECHYCPVQEQCGECYGEGFVPDDFYM